MKDKLVTLGRTKDYECYASGCGEAGAEWLYDLTWLKMEEEEGQRFRHVKDVGLILESEWDTRIRYLMDDFSKLVTGRAKYRVMVFQTKDVDGFTDAMKCMTKEIEGSAVTQNGDRYLFACWIIGEQEFRFEHYVVEGQ